MHFLFNCPIRYIKSFFKNNANGCFQFRIVLYGFHYSVFTHKFYSTKSSHSQRCYDFQVLELDVGKLFVGLVPDRGEQNVRTIPAARSDQQRNKPLYTIEKMLPFTEKSIIIFFVAMTYLIPIDNWKVFYFVQFKKNDMNAQFVCSTNINLA